MTDTATVAGVAAPMLSMRGAEWSALASHAHKENTRYAMQHVAWLPATDTVREWLPGAESVACSTNGKAALVLRYTGAAKRPGVAAPLLAAPPRVKRTKRDLSAEHDAFAAALPDSVFPPLLDILARPEAHEAGYEASVDAWRAMFAVAALGDDTRDTARMWLTSSGVRVHARRPDVDVVASATMGVPPSDDGEPIGLDAALVRAVLDAAELLGESRVCIRPARVGPATRAVMFVLGRAGVALVMPLRLDA